jgi:hypothetical protein
MDPNEVRRNGGKKFKMKLPKALEHYCESFVWVEGNKTKDGRTDLSGNEFADEDVADASGKAEQTGHKIRVKMLDYSCGPKGRSGEFTIDYHKGIVNTHEEVFLLATNRGVIEKPNQVTYSFGGVNYRGKQEMLEALRNNQELQDAMIKEIIRRDRLGHFTNEDDRPASTEE